MQVPHHFKKALLIDIDGTVLVHGDSLPESIRVQRPLRGSVKWVNQKYDKGYGIYFFTSRLPKEKEATEALLDQYGYKYHSVIYGKPYADKTTLIDDRFFQSVLVKRNVGVLEVTDEMLE